MQLLSSANVPAERIIVEITGQKGRIDALKRTVLSYRAVGYRDVSTRGWCRSSVIELSRNHFLLVDVAQHDNPPL